MSAMSSNAPPTGTGSPTAELGQRTATVHRAPLNDRPGVRPMSATVGSLQKGNAQRPSSEILSAHYKSPEAEAIDRWFEDLSYYEQTLEQMARAKMDDNFCEELKHIEQWFNVLSDPERTTALYSLLQNTTEVQIRFFITVLQQMAQKDPATGAVPTPAQVSQPIIDGVRLAQNRVSMPPRLPSPSPPVHRTSNPLDSEPAAEEDDMYLAVGGPRSTRRLFDRHSAPNAEDQYAQLLNEINSMKLQHQQQQHQQHQQQQQQQQQLEQHQQYRTRPAAGHARNRSLADAVPEYIPQDDFSSYKRASYQSLRAPSPARASRNSANMSPLLRPTTPIGDAISSADWSLSVNSPSTTPIIDRPSSRLGNGTFTPVLTGLPDPEIPTLSHLSLQAAPLSRGPYGRAVSPNPHRPVSPIMLTPPTPTGPNPPSLPGPGGAYGHPSPGWGYVNVGRPRTPNSAASYAHSDISDVSYSRSRDGHGEDYFGDGHYPGGRARSPFGAHKEKGKIPESVDLEALKDIPGWLRSLRLHKYTTTFETMNWKDMIKLSEEDLIAKGVGALGARRKLLKVFELVRADLDSKGVVY